MSSECPGKTSWPELVGSDGNDAASVIESQNPGVKAVVILDGSPVTGDFRCDRVWVRVDKEVDGIVVQVPTVG
ncbi:unnamed protein product [Eruca vesicaria subsp. sativa]|uniref:Proteinase inhibitor n=1 Tax=Eruca vesicaria subsp. sativa TaxID=29727 RepID=A0ABC8M3T5_ERUVS|nr:unnamed protein product [Eruca vesicaria subsp. sativa]CAH8390474.1 unnamed protein product [Eruca vesicaria subsp. sativa]